MKRFQTQSPRWQIKRGGRVLNEVNQVGANYDHSAKANVQRLSRRSQAARHQQVLARRVSARHPLLPRHLPIIPPFSYSLSYCSINLQSDQDWLIHCILRNSVSQDARSYKPIEAPVSSSPPRCSFRSNTVILGFPCPNHPSPLLSSMFPFQRKDFNKGRSRAFETRRDKTIFVYKASICSFARTKRVP